LFRDAQDHRVFLFYLYIYTNPAEKLMQKFSDLPARLREKSLEGKLEILAYTLLPDHFHLVVRQREADSLPRLMKQVVNGFTTYYNVKYKHHGPVFTGRYKAVEVPEQTLGDVVRYLHREPMERGVIGNYGDYEWSSFRKYLNHEAFLDFNIHQVLDIFGTHEKLAEFTANKTDYDQSLNRIKSLVMERS